MQYLLNDGLAPAEIVEAGCRGGVLALLEREPFDLVISSLFSAEGDCDDFLDELLKCAPPHRLIILSSVDEPDLICRVLMAGAAGFLLKETPPEVTLQAIRLVLAGGVYVPRAALRVEARGTAREMPEIAVRNGVLLTVRQRAVLDLLSQGACNKEIARKLEVSSGTVKAHVASLLRLYGVANRTKLVQAAARSGAVPPTLPSGSEGYDQR